MIHDSYPQSRLVQELSYVDQHFHGKHGCHTVTFHAKMRAANESLINALLAREGMSTHRYFIRSLRSGDLLEDLVIAIMSNRARCNWKVVRAEEMVGTLASGGFVSH